MFRDGLCVRAELKRWLVCEGGKLAVGESLMFSFEGMVSKNVTGEIYQLWRTFLKLMLLGPKEVW